MEQDTTNRQTDVVRGSFVLEHPHQVEIYSRLRKLIGPGPALFYRDACRHMAAEEPMDTVTHQVGHCVR